MTWTLRERRVEFRDGVTGHMGARCTLVVPAGGRVYPNDGEPKIGVEHPVERTFPGGATCPTLADLSVDLDCFYCPACQWNGRISGAWAVDMIERTLGAQEEKR